jgi:alpha-1,2-mannosyltransferase
MKFNFWKTLVILIAVFSFAWTFYSFYKIINSSTPDFGVLWQASKDLITHINFYTDKRLTFIYLLPPISAIFYLPFSLFSLKVALGLFSVFSLASVVLNVFLSFKIVFKRFKWEYLLFAISLCLVSFPTKFTFGMGQVNSISLLFLLASYYLYSKEKHNASGILLAISIISKPTFGIFIIFYLLNKSWKVLVSAGVTLVVGLVLSILIGRVNLYSYWFTHILPMILNSQGKEVYYNQGVSGFISRLLPFPQARLYLTYLSQSALFITTLYLTIRNKNQDILFSLFIITLLLIDPLSWQHHFVWLIFPFIVTIYHLLTQKNVWLWMLVSISYFLVSWNFKNPSLYAHFPLSLIISNTFYGAVVLYLLLTYLILRYKKL